MLQSVPRDMQEGLKAAIAAAEQTAARPPKPVDYIESQRQMVELNRAGKLNDQSVNRFAVKGEYINVVAALSFLTAVPIAAIERLVGNAQLDGLIVACKAAQTELVDNEHDHSQSARLRTGFEAAARTGPGNVQHDGIVDGTTDHTNMVGGESGREERSLE